jgi:hypothetical protein
VHHKDAFYAARRLVVSNGVPPVRELISGAVRWNTSNAYLVVTTLRYSTTLRTLRTKAKLAGRGHMQVSSMPAALALLRTV